MGSSTQNLKSFCLRSTYEQSLRAFLRLYIFQFEEACPNHAAIAGMHDFARSATPWLSRPLRNLIVKREPKMWISLPFLEQLAGLSRELHLVSERWRCELGTVFDSPPFAVSVSWGLGGPHLWRIILALSR